MATDSYFTVLYENYDLCPVISKGILMHFVVKFTE